MPLGCGHPAVFELIFPMKTSPCRAAKFSIAPKPRFGVALGVALLLSAGLGASEVGRYSPSAADLPAFREMGIGRLVQNGDFVFSILPKSLQKNPTLEMTFNTELTDYGRLLRAASPEHPVYFVEQDAGFHQLGWTVGREQLARGPELASALHTALANNGYLPAATGHPAGLAIIYYWGSHNKPDVDTARDFPLRAWQNTLERAVLVGGKKLAASMSFMMEWGATPADRDDKRLYLIDQTDGDLYYVVASAYDYGALARGERRLAWRTTMTVTSAGLAMGETLPALITSAAPFFGKNMEEPEIGARRVSRDGHIFVGTPTVVDEKPKPFTGKP